MGRGAPERFVEGILGGKLDALRHDLPELTELDNLFAPEGAIREAEMLAGEAFGAAKTWLLANGSTSGIIASILACVRRHRSRARRQDAGVTNGPSEPNSRSVVILPRDAHKSAVHGLVLSGATPSFVLPTRDPDSGISLGVATVDLRAALDKHGRQVAAVLLVSPSYEGVCTDVASAARLCHSAGVPLVIDEAHGAHLGFLEASDEREPIPPGALQSGADLVIQSAHKTLGSLTQSAFLHMGEGMLSGGGSEDDGSFPIERAVSDALATVQSSSPNYLLLASLDAARWSVSGAERRGRRLLEDAVAIAREVRQEVAAMQGAHVLRVEGKHAEAAGVLGMDPLRLSVSFDGVGGFEADDILEGLGVYSELVSPDAVTFVFGPGSTAEHGRILTEAVRHVAREAARRCSAGRDRSNKAGVSIAGSVDGADPPRQVCTPREAFFAPSRVLKAREAIGFASADTVCPYPPGIPVLLPGEVITEEALDALKAVKAGGGMVSGCTDPTLATLRVVDLR